MSFFLNRQSITAINRYRAAHPDGVVCQTNSRLNGNFCEAVRLYKSVADKGHPDRAIKTVTELPELLREP